MTPALFKAFKRILEAGEIPPDLNNKEIVFIPKNGDHSRISNWCPIMLFGSMYKILAKILACRLQLHLPIIVRPN